ncbi:11294_t:CDS:1, partial [Scutellospora calospora]
MRTKHYEELLRGQETTTGTKNYHETRNCHRDKELPQRRRTTTGTRNYHRDEELLQDEEIQYHEDETTKMKHYYKNPNSHHRLRLKYLMKYQIPHEVLPQGVTSK